MTRISTNTIEEASDAKPEKTTPSRNAVTHGIFASWFEPNEQAAYDAVYNGLAQEYGDLGPTAMVLIDRAATSAVKLRRVQQVEDGLFEKARLVRTHHEQQAHATSITSMLPDTKESRDHALAVAKASALPDTAALDAIARYETSFDRQLFKWLHALKVMRDEKPISPPAPVANRVHNVVPLASPARRVQS